jgi:hypothetical protein
VEAGWSDSAGDVASKALLPAVNIAHVAEDDRESSRIAADSPVVSERSPGWTDAPAFTA